MAANDETRPRLRQILADTRAVFTLLRPLVGTSIAGLIVLAFIDTTCAITMPYVTKQLIDSLTAAASGSRSANPMFWLAIETTCALAMLLSTRSDTLLNAAITARSALPLTTMVLEKACNLAYASFENPAFLDALTRARESAPARLVAFALDWVTLSRAIVVFVGTTVLLSTTKVWAIPLAIVSAAPGFVFEAIHAERRYAIERAETLAKRKSWHLAGHLSAERAAQELRTNAAGRWLVRMYDAVLRPFAEQREALSRRHFALSLAGGFVSSAVLYGPYFYIVMLTARGEMTLGDMLLFGMAFRQVAGSVGNMLRTVGKGIDDHMRVRDVLSLLAQEEDDPEEAPTTDGYLEAAPAIEIENLQFGYGDGSRLVLNGVDLKVRPGEIIAMVGRNGSGKTTLVKLLLGLHEPKAGTIRVGGVDISERPKGWLRRNLAVVLQDFTRFHFSALLNIAVGDWNKLEDRELIDAAIEKADAGSVVERLPQGLDSPLGPAFGGGDLSGGQWQRIALARMYVRSKARIWILDEPTKSMDAQSEYEAFRQFRLLARGRTAIVIAHRFSTVRVADRIAVMREGRIVELGTHAELIDLGGHYAELFSAQAKAFSEQLEGFDTQRQEAAAN